MTKDKSTLVLPGGETRCIFSTSTPFAFQVIPGDTDKVLVYFQGGGACWDKASTAAGLCTTDSSPQDAVGAFDRTDVRNEFKSHTIVHITYCSGDLFVGDITRDYNDKAGKPVVQKGQANAQSAVDWIVSQQKTGALASTLTDLAVMGCSAGSIGAQAWGNQVLKAIKWTNAAIVPDSYAGVFPPGSQGPLIYGFGTCTSPMAKVLSADNLARCNAQTLTLQDLNDQYMGELPHVPFSFIQSKTDIVQQSFYIAVGASTNTSAALTPTEFYNDVNTIFGTYNKNHANFLTYLVDGDQHCFSPLKVFLTADPKSSTDDGKTTSSPMMYAWAGSFPLKEGEKQSTVCDGDLVLGSGKDSNTYCSSTVSPKSFTEHY